jgi:FAD/FMN-containing dehydrogenase
MPFIPQEQVGALVLVILICWTGSVEEGERALAPLRALATPVADVVGPMPYPALYQLTGHQSAPHAASVRSMFADDLSDEALDATLDALSCATSPFSVVQFRGLGGAFARVADDATAFAHRERRYFVAIIAAWMDASEEAAAHRAWVGALWRTLRQEGRGAYVNFLQNEGTDRIHDAYPPATFARLAAVKRQYDPQNIFRLNQNIAPTAN